MAESTRPVMRERKERPADLDYLGYLKEAFGNRPALCRMEYVGTTSQTRKPYNVAERVALIEVCGVLRSEAYWYDETGYDEIQAEMRFAETDPDVDGILMLVNSPGGECELAYETADLVAEVGKKKPVWAVASPIAYSAAYLLASQAERIYVQPISGGVGSIGVYCLHIDYSEYLKNEGIRPTFIFAGKGKVDGNPFEPLSAEATKALQVEVDRLYAEFVSRVGRGRSTPESAIIKLGARLYEGSKAALGAGLADQTGTSEEAWMDMATQLAAAKNGTYSATAGTQSKGEGMDVKDKPAAAAAAPAEPTAAGPTPEQLRDSALADGHKSTVEIIDMCALAGKPERASQFLRDKTPAADVRAALLKEKAAASEAAGGGPLRGEILPGEGTQAKPAQSLKDRMLAKGKREGWF